MQGNRFFDIAGQQFNNLTAIDIADKRGKRGEYYWNCSCKCGKHTVVRGDCVRKGRIKSCGCLGKDDLSGKTYGLLTVIKNTGKHSNTRSNNGERIWECICSCGGKTELLTSSITKGKIKSCGCLLGRKQGNNPNWKGYEKISADFWYRITTEAKARKIPFILTIEEAWEKYLFQNGKCALSGLELSFERFAKDKRTASLDRIDSLKGYTKDNIQWVHKHINIMKRKHNQEYFVQLCKLVAKKSET